MYLRVPRTLGGKIQGQSLELRGRLDLDMFSRRAQVQHARQSFKGATW